MSLALEGQDAVLARLEILPAVAQAAIGAKLQALMEKLRDHAAGDKLSTGAAKAAVGQTPGALKNAIKTEVDTSGEVMTGRVFVESEVKYAAVQEYGFHGVVSVKAHLATVVFGRTVAPFLVPAYSRQMNIPAKAYLGGALTDMAGEVNDGLKSTAIQTVAGQIGEAT